MAGVSIKTVSRVMNNEPTVHANTRALVMDVVTQLHYRPQLSARSLAGAKSFLVGLLYREPSAAFVAGIQRGATARCREAGRHLVVESLRDDADVGPQLEAMLAALRPDGMILSPPLSDHPEVREALRANGTPCVLVSPADDGAGLPCVRMDDEQAAAELTELLLGLGHARIAFVQGHRASSERRQRGFERALQAHGVAVDATLVWPGRYDFASGLAAAQALLARPAPPTAIFAANDDMALGVLAGAQRLGIAVPAQLSVVGFDDSRAASLVWPALTTVRQPLEQMAEAAVDMLLSGELKAGLGQPAPVRVLPHRLVVRGSTSGPRPD